MRLCFDPSQGMSIKRQPRKTTYRYGEGLEETRYNDGRFVAEAFVLQSSPAIHSLSAALSHARGRQSRMTQTIGK